MVRLVAGKSDAVVVVFVIVVVVIALVFSTRRVFPTIGLLVNFHKVHLSSPPTSDRVNLGGHVFGHATTCHKRLLIRTEERGQRTPFLISSVLSGYRDDDKEVRFEQEKLD